MNHYDTDAAKGRKIAYEEQIEYIEKYANEPLEESIEQDFQHKRITTDPSYFSTIPILRLKHETYQ